MEYPYRAHVAVNVQSKKQMVSSQGSCAQKLVIFLRHEEQHPAAHYVPISWERHAQISLDFWPKVEVRQYDT